MVLRVLRVRGKLDSYKSYSIIKVTMLQGLPC